MVDFRRPGHICYSCLLYYVANCSLFMLFMFDICCSLLAHICKLLIKCCSCLYMLLIAHYVWVKFVHCHCSSCVSHACCTLFTFHYVLLYVVWLTPQLKLFKFSVSLTNLIYTGFHAITALKVIIQTSTKKINIAVRISSQMAIIMTKI